MPSAVQMELCLRGDSVWKQTEPQYARCPTQQTKSSCIVKVTYEQQVVRANHVLHQPRLIKHDWNVIQSRVTAVCAGLWADDLCISPVRLAFSASGSSSGIATTISPNLGSFLAYSCVNVCFHCLTFTGFQLNSIRCTKYGHTRNSAVSNQRRPRNAKLRLSTLKLL